MQDLFGKLLATIVPWMIPALLVASFLVNHKTPSGGSSSGGDASNKPAKAPQKRAELKQSAPPKQETAPALDAPLSDKDMTE